jgi:hypothetical protein
MKYIINDRAFNIQVQEGQVMQGKSFSKLLNEIASEYGDYKNGEYSVDTRVLDHTSKKLILYYILDSEEYEWALSSELRTDLMFKEHLPYIEDKLWDAAQEVYSSTMEEMGMKLRMYPDNGERYWSRY